MTSPVPRFAYPDSALPAGVALTVTEFIRADPAVLVKQLRQFIKRKFGRWPQAPEVESWKTSIPALQRLLDHEQLCPLMVLLEVSIPGALGRIDCALLGSNPEGPNGLIVLELKAWSNAKRPSDSSDMLIPLPPGRLGHEPRVHPSLQAMGYRSQLNNLLVACHDKAFVNVSAAAWLYNAESCARAPFNDAIFGDVLSAAPIFGASEIAELRTYISTITPAEPDAVYLGRLDTSHVAPSQSLMDRFTASRLDDFSGFALTDDQVEVFNRILNAYSPRGIKKHRVIIVRGGPGAGKSVVALHLLKEFHQKGIPARYVARSQAIINTYNEVFSESKGLFASFMSVGGGVPVLIVDEAHRLSDREQARQCIGSAALTVFLIDDDQIILPGDIGGYRDIEGAAMSLDVNDTKVIRLEGEKRCGSELYVRWLDAVLGISAVQRPAFPSSYHFEIVESPHDLETKLGASGGTWRMMAGLCWPWSDPTEPVDDFTLPAFDFRQPRSPHPQRFGKGTAEHRVAVCWATEPAAQRHVGNVYTAQGFEFDYVGVIVGKDLVVRNGRWVGVIEEHAKSDKQFYLKGAAMVQTAKTRKVLKNIYRVLLTRGRKGCYVFFQDAETKRYVERLIAESESDV